ncbi:MAG TPA: hypothetical protein VL127_07585 [Bryobacteraceae bacterium]|jgi:hypothetical protein|nr:hypothetical protein [Bryobacteraceae bacterium]
MTKGQRNLLGRRLRAAIKYQPEIKLLRGLLLELGGVELVAASGFDPDAPLLIRFGFAMSGSVEKKVMERSACHKNIAALWIAKQSRLLAIGTGYALSDDGLWRQHSWGIRRNGILETTESRVKYFGRALKGREADSFAAFNI